MSEPAPVVSFDRSSPVYAYWLANCEGFRVRAGGRRGVVEEVELGPTGHVARLVVGFGLGRRSVVTPEVVESVIPAKEVIVLRVEEREPSPSRLAPVVYASGRAASTTLHTSAKGSRAAWVSVSRASTAARRETDRFVNWSTPQLELGARRASIAFDVAAAWLVGTVYGLVCSARAIVAPAARAGATKVASRGRELVALRSGGRESDSESPPGEPDERDRAA